MAAISSKRLIKLVPILACFLLPPPLNQVNVPCTLHIHHCFSALSSTVVYDTEFRAFVNSYFDQWSSTMNFSTEFEDFLESLNEDSVLAEPNFVNIVVDTIFEGLYKPSLGFPYQFAGVNMAKVAESGTQKHSVTQQPIKSTGDILKRVPCKIEKLNDVNNRIIFGSHSKIQYVNVLVSEYFQNNKYGCVEFSLIPSRMAQVMDDKKNFNSYYFRITCYIDLRMREMEFYNFGSELCFNGPYEVTDTLAIFDDLE